MSKEAHETQWNWQVWQIIYIHTHTYTCTHIYIHNSECTHKDLSHFINIPQNIQNKIGLQFFLEKIVFELFGLNLKQTISINLDWFRPLFDLNYSFWTYHTSERLEISCFKCEVTVLNFETNSKHSSLNSNWLEFRTFSMDLKQFSE